MAYTAGDLAKTLSPGEVLLEDFLKPMGISQYLLLPSVSLFRINPTHML